jgi:hypothetical protein
MTRPRGFADWRPHQKSLVLLEQVKKVIAQYAMPLTVRQIFYRLVARFAYEKTEHGYENLRELTVRARRSRRIPMEAIRDDGFTSLYPQCWRDIDDFMADMREQAEGFRLDRQQGQPRRLVVTCEASGMAPQLYQHTERYGIPVLSSGGFDSLTDKHRLADEWSRQEQPTTVLRIGDYDPSGSSMGIVIAEDIGAFVDEFMGDVEFVTIAITPEQARLHKLPSAPPKATDRRGDHFTDSETWQAEALDPNDLAQILKDAIEERFAWGEYRATLAREAKLRQELLARLDDDC